MNGIQWRRLARGVEWIAFGLVLIGSGCGRQDSSGSAASMSVDSAYSLVADLRIGTTGRPEPDQFFRISDLDVDAAGDIYVLDAGDAVVRIFDETGTPLRQFGRKGSGPGEFLEPARIAVARDTILIVDSRLHLFSATGDLLQTVSVDWTRVGWPLAVGGGPNGWLVACRVMFNASGPVEEDRSARIRGPRHNTLLARSFDPSVPAFSDPVLTLDGQEFYLIGEAGWAQQPLFAPDPRITPSPSGTFFVTAGDDYRIDVVAADGSPVRSIRHTVGRIPVTQKDFEESLRIATEPLRARTAGEPSEWLNAFDQDYPELPRAKSRPVVGRLLPAMDGSLLVERLDLDTQPFVDGDASVWDYLGPDGAIRGRITVPGRATPLRFTGASLYGIEKDANDVQSVVRWRLVADDSVPSPPAP